MGARDRIGLHVECKTGVGVGCKLNWHTSPVTTPQTSAVAAAGMVKIAKAGKNLHTVLQL